MNFKTAKFKEIKKAVEPTYRSPKSLQETIEIQAVSESGIFRVGENRYSKTYAFSDAHYIPLSEAEKKVFFLSYVKFLNSFDMKFKITLNNKDRDMDSFREEMLIPYSEERYEKFCHAYNDIIEGKIYEGKQGIEQERYLTVTIERNTFDEARERFATIEANLHNGFNHLGASFQALNGNERLKILYDFYHLGQDNEFEFDLRKSKAAGTDWVNDLVNGMMIFKDTYFQTESQYGKCLFIKTYPEGMPDDFLKKLSGLNIHSMISIDCVPIAKEMINDVLEDKYMSIEDNIAKQQERRNRNHNYASDISYKRRKEKKEIEEMMDEINETDESAFFVGVTIVLMADSMEELREATSEVMTLAKREALTKIDVHYLKQREALNTALPIGIRQVENMRVLFGQPLAALMPFTVQELCEKGGCFYGINQISKNIIIGNRKRLLNGNGFVFGVPGAGKSMFCKMEMGYNFLRYPKDQIIVIDPKNEYGDIALNYGGCVINMDARSNNYMNPFEIDLDLLGTSQSVGLIQEKSEFILSLCEQRTQTGLSPQESSILSRCVIDMYTEIGIRERSERVMPTMKDFYEIVKRQPEAEARDLALLLEIFLKGALSIFSHKTNINANARFKVYAIRDLGQQLWSTVMLIMMDSISKQIIENAEKGICTWLYVDEYHMLLDREYTANYLDQLWRKIRAQGGFATGITQNISSVLRNQASKTMLANSEFVAVLKQSKVEDEEFAEASEISLSQLQYSLNANEGCGIIKCGRTIVPFDNTIEKSSLIYQMYNTNFHEIHGTI